MALRECVMQPSKICLLLVDKKIICPQNIKFLTKKFWILFVDDISFHVPDFSLLCPTPISWFILQLYRDEFSLNSPFLLLRKVWPASHIKTQYLSNLITISIKCGVFSWQHQIYLISYPKPPTHSFHPIHPNTLTQK